MRNYILVIPILVSFFVTLFLLPYWIRKAKEIGLVWKDMNKLEHKEVAGSGGIIVVLGFVVGVLFFIAYRIFYLSARNNFLVEIFALLSVILLLAIMGLIDDLFGWVKGGLSKRSRIALVLLATIPLVAINAGKSKMGFPFFGTIDFGVIYPLVLIPIGIIGATFAFNNLAGFNGLEAGQGIILVFSLSIVSFLVGSTWLSVIGLCMTGSLLAFLVFNIYPARVFPGDSLTYCVGGLIAIMAILGNFEKIAVFFFIPYIIETGLKLRGRLVKQSFGKPKPNKEMGLKYNKIYSLNHLTILLLEKASVKPSEKKVVLSIWIFQIVIIVLGFIFLGGKLINGAG